MMKNNKEKDGIHHKSNIAACLYVCVSFSLAHVRRVSLPFFIPAHFIQILRTEGKSSFFKSYSLYYNIRIGESLNQKNFFAIFATRPVAT